MTKKTRSDTQPQRGGPDGTASWAPRALLGAAAGFAIGFIPLGIVMIFALFIRLYDCGYSTGCPSGIFMSWHIIAAGFIASAVVGGLTGGYRRFRSEPTDQAAFQGGRRGALIGEALFAVAYIVLLIWTTR